MKEEQLQIVPFSETRVASLLDVLSVDLLFDTIVKLLFLFCNGVESFCSLALVCRTTYKRALHHGRVKRILTQSFPYLPERLLAANRTDAQMFSLLLSLANPKFQQRRRDRPLLFRNLVNKTLRSTSLTVQYNLQYDLSVTQSRPFNMLDANIDKQKKFYCVLRNNSLAIKIVWVDKSTALRHSRRIVCKFDATNRYEIHATGDVAAEKIYVMLKRSHRASKLLQITVDCSKFVCDGGLPRDQNSADDRDLCKCTNVQFYINDEPRCTEDGFVSCHFYDFGEMTTSRLYRPALSGIAQFLQLYRLHPHLLASINLRTHETALVECREDLYFEIGQTFTVNSEKQKNVCALSRSTLFTKEPFEPHYVLPQFAYRD